MESAKDELHTERLFASFGRQKDLSDAQATLLAVNLDVEPTSEENRKETELSYRFLVIFAEYQEQPYLVDPFLEDLISPIVQVLKAYAIRSVNNKNNPMVSERVYRLTLLLYNYVKFRGYKTIIRFFPHEVGDLSIIIDFLVLPDGLAKRAEQWPLRYILLLWLALVCMIPFDLALFDPEDAPGSTGNTIESIAKTFIGNAGLERSSAANLLSRLYMRNDSASRFAAFLKDARITLKESIDPCLCMGTLQVLCEVTKSAPTEQIQAYLPDLVDTARLALQNKSLMSNSNSRKLQVKLLSRCTLRMISATPRRNFRKGKALVTSSENEPAEVSSNDDIEVPEEVESMLEDILQALQDKETIVRWSAAKGIARVSERLPADFAEQVLDMVFTLFSIHTPAAAAMGDLPPVAEATWHGACLACAELARRGLVPNSKLSELIGWLSKGLYFDIRKGAHSIGSSVRDATAYILWSLSRAQDPVALEPYGHDLARHLVTASLFDREVHIRRAASAAFQEYVGRTSLFPHGIDVLSKADFFSVGVRRNAFLVAAPAVAVHPEYREFLVGHLLATVLRHWDPAMRQLGAESLRAICETDFEKLGLDAASRAARLLETSDTSDVHGGLLALKEISLAYRRLGLTGEEHQRAIFSHLNAAPAQMLLVPRNPMLTEAACHLIAASITKAEIESWEGSTAPYWRQIVNFGLKHRASSVQEASAAAMAAVSEFRHGGLTAQQSLARLLGMIDYNKMDPDVLRASVDCLLASTDRSSPGWMASVEARRNCYQSMHEILAKVIENLPERLEADRIICLFDSLLIGLNDYSVDERGDVGSWIRMAAVDGLTTVSSLLLSHARFIPNFAQYLPPDKFHAAVGGILKQGVERLDNVRQHAGQHFLRLLELPLPETANPQGWQVEGQSLFAELLSGERTGWNDSAWLYPNAVRFLDVRRYREPLLEGLVLSIASKTDSTQRPASSSLVAYASNLPVLANNEGGYDLVGLTRDLLDKANANLSSNTVVVPRLQTFAVLLEGDALEKLQGQTEGQELLRKWLSLASRSVSRLKNLQRIQLSMKIVVNLLSFPDIYESAVPCLETFLVHQFPKIRADTAEVLYLVLQTKDIGRGTDEVEEILLETEWSKGDVAVAQDAANRIKALLESQDA